MGRIAVGIAGVACAFLIGCSETTPPVDLPNDSPSQSNALPFERFPAVVAARESIEASKTPTIVVESSKASDDGSHFEAKLILVNPLDVPIRYYGYGMDSWSETPASGRIDPLYQIESLGDDGVWQDDFVGWCGMGAGTMVVPPGEAGSFVAYLESGKTYRVRVGVQSDAADGTTIRDAISPAIGATVETTAVR